MVIISCTRGYRFCRRFNNVPIRFWNSSDHVVFSFVSIVLYEEYVPCNDLHPDKLNVQLKSMKK